MNKLTYTLVGDYYISNLELSEEKRSIGKYGQMHRDYLKEHKSFLYQELVFESELWTYLADLNEQAEERLEVIEKQM